MTRPSFTYCFVLSFLCGWLSPSYADVHTRSLASSCAACHGTNGNSVGDMAALAGMDATTFTAHMLAFKHGTRKATVMHRHAAGLSEAEISALAQYFSKQVKTPPTPLRSAPVQAH